VRFIIRCRTRHSRCSVKRAGADGHGCPRLLAGPRSGSSGIVLRRVYLPTGLYQAKVRPGLLLTAAVAAGEGTIQHYDIPGISASLDPINIMGRLASSMNCGAPFDKQFI
jgi:hypothetical protein